MQIWKAAELRRAWVRKGNPLCVHPELEREYDKGSNTGDVVCTTCGASHLRDVLVAQGKANALKIKERSL